LFSRKLKEQIKIDIDNKNKIVFKNKIKLVTKFLNCTCLILIVFFYPYISIQNFIFCNMLKKDEEFKATEQAKLNSANKMIKFNADDFFFKKWFNEDNFII